MVSVFDRGAGERARRCSVRIEGLDGFVARGTILALPGLERSVVIFPADAVRPGLRLVWRDAPAVELDEHRIHLLSGEDHLALAVLPARGGLTRAEMASEAPVGAFVGYHGGDRGWRTGTVTHSQRSAGPAPDSDTLQALENHWARIGLRVSQRRHGFPAIVETDLPLQAGEEEGVPVFDRSGAWIGIAISRADHHATYLVPADRVLRLIERFGRERDGEDVSSPANTGLSFSP